LETQQQSWSTAAGWRHTPHHTPHHTPKAAMDLSEVRAGSSERHPWETARAEAIEQILQAHAIRPRSILDVGCGDGFTGEHLLAALGAESLWGVDVHLSADDRRARSRAGVHYVNELAETSHGFELGLLCDVIEHVEDDSGLTSSVLSRLALAGHLLITVPSFQSLFSNHDRALRHYRRYSLPQLRCVIAAAGGEPIADGYLFGSLLPVRLLEKVKERLLPARSDAFGVGNWRAPRMVTQAMNTVFRADNRLMLSLSAGRIKPPGLSAWALCRKRR
jgi:SAM-dependent methyltransferase